MEKLFCKDYTGQFTFCGIDLEELAECFKKGNYSGSLMEHVIRRVLNLCKPSGTQLDHDALDLTLSLWEIRCLTEGGVKIAPSNQIGASRNFNEKITVEKYEKLKGLLIADIRNFPIIICYRIDSKELLGKLRHRLKNGLTANMFDKYIYGIIPS